MTQRFKHKKQKKRFLRKKEEREKLLETGKRKRPSKPKERPIYVGDEQIIHNHFARLNRLLQEEGREDRLRFKVENLDKKPEEKERAGKALYHLGLFGMHYNPSGQRLLTFGFLSGRALPRYTLGAGDVVRLSGFQTPDSECPTGTVYEKDRKQITVAFHRDLPSWVGRDKSYQLTLSESKTTYDRMYETLREIGEAKHTRATYFRDLSLGLRKPRFLDPVQPKAIEFQNKKLNDLQKRAICMAFEAEDILLVHGPPGTGKTCVLAEIVAQAKKRGENVLASAPSNAACDHLVDLLVENGIPVTRLGHPARMTERIRDHTLSYKIARHSYAKLIEEHEARIEQMGRQRERRQDRRVMSWGEKREMRDEFRELRGEIRQLRAEIFRQVWNESDVVVATHTVCGDPLLKGRSFDWVVIDEATQGIEPSTWIPIARASGRLVMAGDHCQLPPTVFSPKTGRGSLRFTLFERFHEILEDPSRIRLEIQYRMHEQIMNFSSQEFYAQKLQADGAVAKHTLEDLPNVAKSEVTESPIVFLDTAGLGYEEKLDRGSESYSNDDEAKLIIIEYSKLLKAGVMPTEIAIISPYSAQVKLLAQLIYGEDPDTGKSDGPEIDSIDAFQGREKEAVIVSLVRSNLTGKIGFLADTRRMNVAMTRARRKLIVIGDSATISKLTFYVDFIRYVESVKGYLSAWEYVT